MTKPLYADALDWNVNGNALVYDAVNEYENYYGETEYYWDFNVMDVESEAIYAILPPLGLGLNAGNPTFSQTNNNILAFDFFDNNNQLHYIMGVNLYSGEMSNIIYFYASDFNSGYPCYSTDDKHLIFHVYFEDYDEYDILTINYTSGTTGRPKGVMYHHRGAYLNALGEQLEFHTDADSVYLWTLPMFHCNGWCFTWGITAVGATHVCLRKVVPEEIYRIVKDEGVTHLCAAPTVLIGMSAYATDHQIKLDKPLEIMTAGAPPAPTVIQNMESVGANITQTYGLTEVFGPHSVCQWQNKWDGLSPEKKATYKARQGVPYIIAEHMDVVNPETMAPVPRDGMTMGEIVMRGNNVMLGYYKDPEATANAFHGGWFHSGDLAVMHPDNYAQIMDRKKDVIISGGENISTVEVESILYKHPDVMEVAVVPIPDEKWGEVPKAFVVPRPGSNPDAKSIIDFCKENLARFKAPKAVEFGELPKTATGKIQKYKLREKEWEGRARMVN